MANPYRAVPQGVLVTLVNEKTGEEIVRQSVDAREIEAGGGWRRKFSPAQAAALEAAGGGEGGGEGEGEGGQAPLVDPTDPNAWATALNSSNATDAVAMIDRLDLAKGAVDHVAAALFLETGSKNRKAVVAALRDVQVRLHKQAQVDSALAGPQA